MSKRPARLPSEVEEAIKTLHDEQIVALDRLIRMDAGDEPDPEELARRLATFTHGLELTRDVVKQRLAKLHADRELRKQSLHPVTAAALDRSE
jgi:hypothetical protein